MNRQQDEQGMDPRDQQLAQALRGALRASEAVDAVTAARLAAARRRALTAPAAAHPAFSWGLPAGMAAAALALALWVTPSTQPGPALADTRTAAALDVLTDDNDPQFYRDLEFYQWLEQQQGRGHGHV
jgi:hypothetical protein